LPATHTAEPLLGFWQTFPQAPQFCASVSSCWHAPAQLLKLASQVTPHTPLLHSGCPWLMLAQTAPQLPQLAASVARLTQALPQFWVPVPQFEAQSPALHTSCGPHCLPHAPQLLGSAAVLTHAPLQSA